FALLRRFPAAVIKETAGMSRIGLLLIEIALGTDVVGDAPGDMRRAADHDGGHAGLRDARHLEGAAMQVDLVPERDGGERDVRIAGDQRLARGGAAAGEDPVVAAGAGAVTAGKGRSAGASEYLSPGHATWEDL